MSQELNVLMPGRCCTAAAEAFYETLLASGARDAPLLLYELNRQLRTHTPTLEGLLGGIVYRVTHFENALAIPIWRSVPCQKCQGSGDLIVYSSRFMLLLWRLQMSVLSLVEYVLLEGENLRWGVRVPTAEDVEMVAAARKDYLEGDHARTVKPIEIPTVAEWLGRPLRAVTELTRAVSFGGLWVLFHELAHALERRSGLPPALRKHLDWARSFAAAHLAPSAPEAFVSESAADCFAATLMVLGAGAVHLPSWSPEEEANVASIRADAARNVLAGVAAACAAIWHAQWPEPSSSHPTPRARWALVSWAVAEYAGTPRELEQLGEMQLTINQLLWPEIAA